MDQFLLTAARTGDIHFLKSLMKQGADINVQDQDGNTPLAIAVQHGKLHIIKELINAGAEINKQNYNGETPLMHATVIDHLKIIEYLLNHNADLKIEDLDVNTALTRAITLYKTDSFELLLKNSTNVNAFNSQDMSPLMIAAAYDNLYAIDKLMAAGAKINLQNKWGITALMTAVINEGYKAANRLINIGADVNVANIYGNNTLNVAMQQEPPSDIIDQLIAKGATVPLSYSQDILQYKLVNFLKKLQREFVMPEENILEGLCHGLSASWLFFKAIGKEHEQFWSVVEKLSRLEEDELLQHEKEIDLLFQHVFWLQQHKLNIPEFTAFSQGDTSEQLGVQTLTKVTSTLSFAELKFVLSQLIKPNVMIQISSPVHSISIIQKDDKIYLYDPNVIKGEMVFDSVSDLLIHCVIMATPDFAQENHYPFTINCMQHPEFPLSDTTYPSEEVIFDAIFAMRKDSDAQISIDEVVLNKSALHQAALSNSQKSIKLLLQNGANINITDNEQITPLHVAAGFNNVEALSELLASPSIDLTAKDKYGRTALTMAIICEQTNIIKVLVNKKSLLEVRDNLDRTPLLIAVAENNEKAVKILLDNNVDIHAATNKGQTALSFAIENSNTTIISMLIQKGIRLKELTPNGTTVITEAIGSENLSLIPFLIDNGADVNQVGSTSPLHTAVTTYKLSTVQLLLEKGADINVLDIENNTPLHIAAKQDSVDIIATFLNTEGMDTTVQNHAGHTPLFSAVIASQYDAIEILAKNKSSLEIENHENLSPLMFAAQTNLRTTIKVLLDNGASPNHKNINGDTAITIAAKNGNKDAIKLLLDANANINLQNNKGESALIIAAKENNIALCRFLIKKGADVTLTDFDNKSISDYLDQDTLKSITSPSQLSPSIKEKTFVPSIFSEHPEKLDILTAIEHDDVLSMLTIFRKQKIKINQLIPDKKENMVSLLMYACQSGAINVVAKLLKNKYVEIDLQDNNGSSALFYAIKAEQNNVALLQQLQLKNADPTLKNKEQLNPLELAKTTDNLELINLIEDWGNEYQASKRKRTI